MGGGAGEGTQGGLQFLVALEVRSARVGPIKPIRGSDGLEDPT